MGALGRVLALALPGAGRRQEAAGVSDGSVDLDPVCVVCSGKPLEKLADPSRAFGRNGRGLDGDQNKVAVSAVSPPEHALVLQDGEE